MESLLLQTKLNIPVTRGNVVARPRLIDHLNADFLGTEGFARRLTLISAPAGYGKTTMAIEWLSKLAPKVLWLSLDEEDNDPVRFVSYLVAAFQQANTELGSRTLEMLKAPQLPQVETILTPLINDLSDLSSPLILTLDDYHLIQNTLIHQMVSFLLDHQPAYLHQVILTREDPLLPVSRLLSRGQAREVRQNDLRFTPGETADFLNRTMGLELTKKEIAALQRRTEGWVAGLQLVALSLQGHAEASLFIEYFAGSNRYILDYLFEEVFIRQTADVQDFLIRTSILNQLSIGLCDYLVERNDSRNQLEALERANLFILPLDAGREWYRYHRLFRDLLRHRLRLNQEAREANLHLRACDWYQKNGPLSEAIYHAQAAADWHRACELVLSISESMMKGGEIITLLAWFRQFPDTFIRANPELAIEYVWTLILVGQNELAVNLLHHIESFPLGETDYLGSIYSARAYIARSEGDVQGTIEYSQRALELLPESEKSQRSILAVNLGIAYWHNGQIEDAEQALLEAQSSAQETENYYAVLASLIFLGRVEAVRGNLHRAVDLFQRAINNSKSSPLSGLAYLDLSAVQFEWNDLGSCRENLIKGQEINEISGNIEFQLAGYLLQARLENALGNPESVNEIINKLIGLEDSKEVQAPNRARSQAMRAEIDLQKGDLTSAKQLVDKIKIDVDGHTFYRFFGLIRERILIAEGDKELAGRSLISKAEQAKSMGWIYGWLAVQILRAISAENQGIGVQLLTEALVRSRQEGFIRIYADYGQAITSLLMETAQRGGNTEYIGQILAAIKEEHRKDIPSSGPIEQLSEREVEVLRLVSAGLTNKEIAGQLYLSPGTIKTHVHNICGKLEVANRTQAVVRARDLNLI